MQMWFCRLIIKAPNLSWVLVSPAAQQKSVLPPNSHCRGVQYAAATSILSL